MESQSKFALHRGRLIVILLIWLALHLLQFGGSFNGIGGHLT